LDGEFSGCVKLKVEVDAGFPKLKRAAVPNLNVVVLVDVEVLDDGGLQALNDEDIVVEHTTGDLSCCVDGCAFCSDASLQ